MPNYLRHRGNQGSNAPNTDWGPSPFIWADFPQAEIANDPSLGIHIYDNFSDYPLIGTQTTQIAHGKYKVFATTGSSVTPASSINSVERIAGGLAFSTDTDNDSASLAQAYPQFMISGLSSNSGKLWFEASVAVNTILTNTHGFFCGLAETDQFTLATGVPFNGASATITAGGSMVGFTKDEDGLGVVKSVYSDRATSFTDVSATAGTISAAFTAIKLGMVYDPEKSSDCLSFYVNGVDTGSYLSASQLTALTNLDANALGLMFNHIADSAGTSSISYLRWWRCGQLLVA